MKRRMNFGKKLSKVELKEVKGGGCGYGSPTGSDVTCVPYGGAAGAEHMAGATGWWCCGCEQASGC